MTHDYEVKVRLREKDYRALALEAEELDTPIAVLARSLILQLLRRPPPTPPTDSHNTE